MQNHINESKNKKNLNHKCKQQPKQSCIRLLSVCLHAITCFTSVRLYHASLRTAINIDLDHRRSSPLSATLPLSSGGSLRIGRGSRTRSKSPFRSFRWKRGSSRAIDSDDEEGNNTINTNTHPHTQKTHTKNKHTINTRF